MEIASARINIQRGVFARYLQTYAIQVQSSQAQYPYCLLPEQLSVMHLLVKALTSSPNATVGTEKMLGLHRMGGPLTRRNAQT